VTGISSSYVLCNLISSTEQFTLYYYLLFNDYDPRGGTVLLHTPPSAGDWFSLCHNAIVSLFFLGFFAQVLRHSGYRVFRGAIYTSFLPISTIPLLIESLWPMKHTLDRNVLSTFFAIVYMGCIYPIVTGLGILAIFCQAREICKVPFPNALSVYSLAMRAVVFMLVAVAWIWSLSFDYDGHWNWTTFYAWYTYVGWVIVNASIFALGQAALLVMALPHSSVAIALQHGETGPLLG
ncbi:hypothetical protein N7501_011951, partial [Penicillium viridicatum]